MLDFKFSKKCCKCESTDISMTYKDEDVFDDLYVPDRILCECNKCEYEFFTNTADHKEKEDV